MVCAGGVCIPTVGLFPFFLMLFKRIFDFMCNGFRFVEGTGGGYFHESPASAAKKYQAAVQARYPAVVPAFAAAEAVPTYGSVAAPAGIMATATYPASAYTTGSAMPIASTLAAPAMTSATVAAPVVPAAALAAPAVSAATVAAPAVTAAVAAPFVATPAVVAPAVAASTLTTSALSAPAGCVPCTPCPTICIPATVCPPAVPCSPSVPCSPVVAGAPAVACPPAAVVASPTGAQVVSVPSGTIAYPTAFGADSTTVITSPAVAGVPAASPIAVSPLAASPVAATQSTLASTMAAPAITAVGPAGMASVPISMSSMPIAAAAGMPTAATLASTGLATSAFGATAFAAPAIASTTASAVPGATLVPTAVATAPLTSAFAAPAYTAAASAVGAPITSTTVLPLSAAPVAGTAAAALTFPSAAEYPVAALAPAALAPAAFYPTAAYNPTLFSATDAAKRLVDCCRQDKSCHYEYASAAREAEAAARYMKEAEAAAFRAEKAAHLASAQGPFRARRSKAAYVADAYMPSPYAEAAYGTPFADVKAFSGVEAYPGSVGPVSPAYLPYAQATRGAPHMAAATKASKLAYAPAVATYAVGDRPEHAFAGAMPYHAYDVTTMAPATSMVAPGYTAYGYRIDTDVVPEFGRVVEIPSKEHFARFMVRAARQNPQKVVCGYVGEDNGPSRRFEELLSSVARSEPTVPFCVAKPECAFRGTHISSTPCLVCYGFDQGRQAWVEQARVEGYDAPKIHSTITKFAEDY